MITPISKQQVFDFLKSVSIMSLAACDGDKPLATVLLFAIDEDLTIYFATRESSHKAVAIQKNPQVSLTVWYTQQMLVQIDGNANRIHNPNEVNEAMNKIVEASSQIKNFWPPLLSYNTHDPYAIFAIKPTWVRALNLSNDVIKAAEPPFTQIAL